MHDTITDKILDIIEGAAIALICILPILAYVGAAVSQ